MDFGKSNDNEGLQLASASSAVRKDLTLWSLSLAASLANSAASYVPNVSAPGWVAPRAGSVTGITLASFGPFEAGTVTVRVKKKSGGSTTTLGSFLVATAQPARTTFADGLYAYAAGDVISVWIETSNDYAPLNNGTAISLEVTES